MNWELVNMKYLVVLFLLLFWEGLERQEKVSQNLKRKAYKNSYMAFTL